MNELPPEFNRLSESIIGAAIEVHRALGPGYLEKVYEEALSVEFDFRGISYRRQHAVSVMYRNKPCGEGILDFLVADSLVVELKTVERLSEIHHAQVLSYLKAMGCHLGLLINFNVLMLRDGVKRVIRT